MKLKSMISVVIVASTLLGAATAKSQKPLSSLTERQLSDLRIHSCRAIQAVPGQTIHLRIRAWSEEFYTPVLEDVAVQAKWSISPKDGTQLNADTGELRIGETAKPGTEYAITAVVVTDKRKQTIKNTLHVFTPASNPFVGRWTDTRNEVRELIFRADGTFSVTAIPFEVYKDYWGKYSYDLKERSILFEATGGNNIAKDSDLRGSFRFSGNDTLAFENIYFGTLIEEFQRRDSYVFRKR